MSTINMLVQNKSERYQLKMDTYADMLMDGKSKHKKLVKQKYKP